MFDVPESAPEHRPTYWTLSGWCSRVGPAFKYARSPHGDVLLIRDNGTIAPNVTFEPIAAPIDAVAYAVGRVERAANLDELCGVLNNDVGFELQQDPAFFAAGTALPTFGGARPDAEAVSWIPSGA